MNITSESVTQQIETEKSNLTLRVGPLTNIEPLLRSLECSPVAVFQRAGVDMEYLRDPDHRISYHKGARLVKACAEATRCTHFGLLLGQWFLVAHLGLAGELSRTAPNVRSALQDLVDNLNLHDSGAVAMLDISDRYTTFSYAINLSGVAGVEYVYDLSITNMCGIMRGLCGMKWAPAEVHLSRAEPENAKPYQRYFRAPVQFGAHQNAIIFPSHWLKLRQGTGSRGPRQHLVTTAKKQHEDVPHGIVGAVRDAIRSHLSRESIRVVIVAKQLGMHERTLHRRLHAEGTNFRTLLDEVRQNVSQHYLSGSALPINEISMALGYSNIDAFDHAFQRWYGVSPSRWRQSNG